MQKLSVRDLDVKGRGVFLRVDFNVPLGPDGSVRSDARIKAALPTLKLLVESGAAVICGSHLGKPKGKPDPALTLLPVAERLRQLLTSPVEFWPVCSGPEAAELANRLKPGVVALLENLRFHPGETANDLDFARGLASLADEYVNDAFGVAHRSHASVDALPRQFPRPAAGLLMARELEYLGRVIESPARPFVAIIGGSKVADKAGVIANLLTLVDRLLIGGGAAFSFLKRRGLNIGQSVWEPGLPEKVLAAADSQRVVLPADVVVAASPDASSGNAVPVDQMPAEQMGLDIGPETQRIFAETIAGARTIVWAGPMGVFEQPHFAGGTLAVAKAVAAATANGATTVVAGGDTAAALEQFGYLNRVSHVSTGGGACLKFLEGSILPGVAALADRRP